MQRSGEGLQGFFGGGQDGDVDRGVYAHFFFQAEDGIRDLYVTGVQTCALPILSFTLQFAVEGRKGNSGTDDLRARFRFVSPRYFATLGIPILEGRDFTEADRKESEQIGRASCRERVEITGDADPDDKKGSEEER